MTKKLMAPTSYLKRFGRTAFILLVIFIFLASGTSSTIYALTEADRENLYTPFYDPDSTDPLCGGDFTGSNNAEIAYNYLTSQGLTAAQAAGIVGNLMTESGQGVDPAAVSPSGYRGIAQWDGSVRWPRLVEWAEAAGKDELALETQLEYMFFEATGRGNIEGIKAYDDVPLAAWYWGRYFEVAIIGGSTSEVPLTNVQALERRIQYALVVYATYSGNSVNGETCSQTLGEVTCPANMEAHPTRSGYYKMPEAPNDEYTIYSISERRYGSQQLVCVLYSVALAYNEAMAGQSRMRIGDLNAAGHRSHKWGVAVDLSGFGDIQAASWTKDWKGTYSKDATITLGKLFIDTGVIRNIWWCPPDGDDSIEQILAYADETQGGIEGQMKCISGHDDHFHVDIQSRYRLPEWEP